MPGFAEETHWLQTIATVMSTETFQWVALGHFSTLRDLFYGAVF